MFALLGFFFFLVDIFLVLVRFVIQLLMLQAKRLKQEDEGDDIDVEKDDNFNASDGKDVR